MVLLIAACRIGEKPENEGEVRLINRTVLGEATDRIRQDLNAAREIYRNVESRLVLGLQVAGVAHEINNPLTGVLTFTPMLLRRKDLSPEVRADLQTVAESTDRVRKIVKGLLDFSRQTAIELKPTQVNAMIKETLGLVANQALVKGVTIRFDPGENLPAKTLDKIFDPETVAAPAGSAHERLSYARACSSRHGRWRQPCPGQALHARGTPGSHPPKRAKPAIPVLIITGYATCSGSRARSARSPHGGHR